MTDHRTAQVTKLLEMATRFLAPVVIVTVPWIISLEVRIHGLESNGFSKLDGVRVQEELKHLKEGLLDLKREVQLQRTILLDIQKKMTD